MSMNTNPNIISRRTGIHLQNGPCRVELKHSASTYWVEVEGTDGVAIFFDTLEEFTSFTRALFHAAEGIVSIEGNQ